MTADAQHTSIGAWLTERIGRPFSPRHAEAVHGGSINRCVRWPGQDGDAFVKLASPANLSTYEAEADGLDALRVAAALRVPHVLAVGVAGDHAVLALEWFDFSPLIADQAPVQARLGEQLARQHRVTSATFGWHRANTIGATYQPNDEDDDWVRFYRRRRLQYQLDLAAGAGLDRRVVDRGCALCERLAEFFVGYRPAPSLLHGDFWGGNWSADARTREPVIYDPAVYFGDREADLAFTHLFGGFGPAFYAAYEAAWPLDAGATSRRTLYNLYHVLNHCTLFGGSYARQASTMIERLLAELG